MNVIKKADNSIIIISLLAILVFIILFVFRSADDNRLTSWQWVFTDVNTARIYSIFIAGLVAACAVSRVSLPERYFPSFLLLSSFISAAIFWKIPEAIVDASRYFTQAKHFEVYGMQYFLREWGREINAWTDMPLVPFLYGLIFKFLGESRVYIQAFNTLLFSLTVVLTYLIGKALWDRMTGFYAAMLLLGIPYLFSQVPLMLVDVPTMFFLMFSVFTFIRAVEHGKVWIPISSIAIFLAFYSKYSTWLMMSVLPVIFLIYVINFSLTNRSDMKLSLVIPPHPHLEKGGRGNLMHFKNRNFIFLRGSLVFLFASFLIGIVFLYKFDVFSEQIRLLLSYQVPGLRRWSESVISTFFFQIHPFITAFAVYSAYVAFKKRDIKYAVISCLIILILLLQIKRIRYIIMAFPMLTLMASYGLQEIRDRDIRKFIVLCIVISSLTIGIFAYLPFLQKISAVNLKHAGEFLDSIDEENIEVFTMPQKEPDVNPAVTVPVLDLFTKKRITYHYDKGLYHLPEDFEKSPLRFTWEYRNPGYYAIKPSEGKTALVIISGEDDTTVPQNIRQKIKKFHQSKPFDKSDDIFSHKTFVTVYFD